VSTSSSRPSVRTRSSVSGPVTAARAASRIGTPAATRRAAAAPGRLHDGQRRQPVGHLGQGPPALDEEVAAGDGRPPGHPFHEGWIEAAGGQESALDGEEVEKGEPVEARSDDHRLPSRVAAITGNLRAACLIAHLFDSDHAYAPWSRPSGARAQHEYGVLRC